MKALPWIAFPLVLAACAHSPAREQWLVPGLSASGDFRESGWAPDAAGEGEWRSGEGAVLRIQATEGISESEARSRMESKRKALQHHLEAQVDPYYGTLSPNAACDLESVQGLGVTEEEPGLRLEARLGADSDLQLECYGAGEPAYLARYLLLYCRGQSTLYELKHFQPFDQARLPMGPLPVACDPTAP